MWLQKHVMIERKLAATDYIRAFSPLTYFYYVDTLTLCIPVKTRITRKLSHVRYRLQSAETKKPHRSTHRTKLFTDILSANFTVLCNRTVNELMVIFPCKLILFLRQTSQRVNKNQWKNRHSSSTIIFFFFIFLELRQKAGTWHKFACTKLVLVSTNPRLVEIKWQPKLQLIGKS